MEYRIEKDSMGEVKVPGDKLWGAQTQRSCNNFDIGVNVETMPKEIIHAFGIFKNTKVIKNLIELNRCCLCITEMNATHNLCVILK